jgi:hypothetical protein
MSTTTLKNLISLEEGYVTLYVRYTFYQAMWLFIQRRSWPLYHH